MKYMHSEWRGRLDHWIDTLKKDFYHPLGPITVEAALTMEQLTPEQAGKLTFVPMEPGTAWGHTWEYCWLRGTVTLPPEAEGRLIVMDLNTGGETTVFVDGKSFGTYRDHWVKIPHHYIEDNFLTVSGHSGESYDILLEAYAGHYYPQSEALGNCATGPVLPGTYTDPKANTPRAVLGQLSYGIWNEDAYQLFMDLETLRLLIDQVDPESLRADKLAAALEQATLTADFEQSFEDRIRSYRSAREVLKGALSAVNGTTAPQFYAIGNAHLDLAWLWPMEETHRKTSRTFAAQLRLIEEYPEYKFIQSQPAGYVMCREHYPELYERIKEAAKKGQWIAEGAMWVEPDTNMTGGESLVRQLIHGKRFFREEFGIDSVLLWLPDTFGYSAALPQLLKGCGVKYLVTQKIFWSYNEGDRFPWHYFTWQGADGSSIDSFLPTNYTYRTDPQEICEVWNARVQKRGLDAFLFPFGYGDGGGGPSRDYLEFLRREKDLEGMPRVKTESPLRFFEDMEAAGGPQHTYVGELYFSAHRGVFTSQAAIKRGNRKAEIALREAEMWGSLARLRGADYPLSRMDAAWKLLLLNQFHDILPGSSIGKVYEKARKDHAHIISEAESVKLDALAHLAEGNEGISIFNSLSFPRSGLVPLPESFSEGAVTENGTEVPVQQTEDGLLGLVCVPSCGAVTLKPKAVQLKKAVSAQENNDSIILENEEIRVVISRRGEVTSFIEKNSGREFAAGPMNRLLMFKDVPRKFDAWDIDSHYILQEVPLEEPVSVSIREEGGLRAVIHVKRDVLHSSFEQDIILTAGSQRLDFVTHIVWKELHRLLKVEFPVNVQAAEGINEIQFGYMKHPTHRSRPYDIDRYEVCNQRYSALCDESHGAAVLNDCKYGISMNGNALQLTLLRAAASPEMRADNGAHTFTYAFTAWEGSFLSSPVVREAYDLNIPLQTVSGTCSSFSALETDADNIFIDTVKPAENGSGDLIIRLYEAKRADTVCRLKIRFPVESVSLCDMLENESEKLSFSDPEGLKLHFHTFEVKTLRVRPGSGPQC
ncbi:MAG: alpha-mannosidase [Anaerolineaceae bacterium]|nr:alpha-mannosidase [Anaerolineaceae bacterium]